jgi:hypothetical protein
MNHRVGVLGMVLLGLLGCAHHGQQTRMQAADDKDAEVKTIGDVTAFANADPIPVAGIGLVVGLEGTGGTPVGPERSFLEDQLRKKGVEHVKELLASKDVAMVRVSALVPAGARKDDPLDVEVALPPDSPARSLQGGYLRECMLYNYDNAKSLDPDYKGPDHWMRGHPIVRTEGALMVAFGDGDEAARLRQGRLWGGGRCRIDRPFFLSLNSDQQFARLASAISDRVNETFHGGVGTDMALAKTKQLVFLNVPAQYRHNLPRYLRVVRLIPLRENLDRLRHDHLGDDTANAVAVGRGSPYRRKLEHELLDPKRTVIAALRLEALGTDSIPTLKLGLESKSVLVRFAAAEALAYLGCPACGEELARLVEQQPALRAYCLTALASLNEAVSHIKLTELLCSKSAETRYGAFRALRALDEHEAAVQGEMLGDSFWLHRVAPNAPGLVHLSSSRRAEVVLFGEDAELIPPFSILAGEFTVTANAKDDHCTICRTSLQHGRSSRQCSLRLEDVLRTMADLGGMYPDVVELVRHAEPCKALSSAWPWTPCRKPRRFTTWPRAAATRGWCRWTRRSSRPRPTSG